VSTRAAPNRSSVKPSPSRPWRAVPSSSQTCGRRAPGHSVCQARISHALNGRRIHQTTLRDIGGVLRATPPLEEVDTQVYGTRSKLV
jgi:hypothetical protein